VIAVQDPDDERSSEGAGAAPQLVSLGRGGPDFELVAPGEPWRYRGKDVTVPGAVPVTLEEAVAPRMLARPGEDPEGVVLSLSELIEDARLAWVLQAGTRLEGGDETLFLVPWPVWQEHANEIVDVWAPERDGTGAARQLAIVERETRLRRHELELVTAKRTEAVAIATALGMSRRQVGALLDVTGTRVQQLLDDAPKSARAAAEQFVADARAVLARDSGGLPSGWDDERFARTVQRMADWGLLAGDPGDALVATDLGRNLVAPDPKAVARR
jgi:hypothetical protein